ncbi:MAG: hypothetical protein R3F34_09685 [Planctomycetota bacterium]
MNAFTSEGRDRVRSRVVAAARADARVVAAALVGSLAHGGGDAWSDVDLTFAVAEGVEPLGVLGSFEELLAREFDAAVLFDVPFGTTTYRVFLLPGALQVDLSVTPCAAFRPLGPRFELLFGSAAEADPVAAPELRPLVGGVHHLLRAGRCDEDGRGSPCTGSTS